MEGAHRWEFCKGPVLEFIEFNILAKDRQIGLRSEMTTKIAKRQ